MEKGLNKKQLQYQKTLAAIREAVDKLVPEMGFEKMRIVDICNAVGVTPGAFYTYFPSKEELLFDRYVRANKEMLSYYEKELAYLDEVEALKRIFIYRLQYAKTRVVGVFKSYSKVSIDRYSEWVEKEPDAGEHILRQIVEKGRKRGVILSQYTNEEILAHINCMLAGAGYLQCCSSGTYLQNDHLTNQVCDWIEKLRFA